MPDTQTLNQSQIPKPPISTTTPSKASTDRITAKPAATIAPTTPSANGTANGTTSATSVTTRRRRSARVLEHDPILAPGFGTRKDISKLARELSANGTTLTVAAVEALMKSRGTGVRRSQEAEAPAAAAAAAPASTAWADFMAEEGTTTAGAATAATGAGSATASGSGAAAAAAASTPTPAASTSTTTSQAEDSKKRKSVSTGVPGARRVYELPIGESLEPGSAKKAKGTAGEEQGGVLLQAGTLDSATVGRTKSKLTEPYHLTVPTKILPNVRITKVFASCNAVHSIALDSTGQAWCWGRNEAGQLGATFPAEVILPAPMELPGGKMVMAAIGKSHTLFLMEDGSVCAVGANKAGQCGVKSSVDLIPNYRKCVLPEDVTIVKVCYIMHLCMFLCVQL
jgi:hypothetical protein